MKIARKIFQHCPFKHEKFTEKVEVGWWWNRRFEEQERSRLVKISFSETLKEVKNFINSMDQKRLVSILESNESEVTLNRGWVNYSWIIWYWEE